jgi:hypothetical protein
MMRISEHENVIILLALHSPSLLKMTMSHSWNTAGGLPRPRRNGKRNAIQSSLMLCHPAGCTWPFHLWRFDAGDHGKGAVGFPVDSMIQQ